MIGWKQCWYLLQINLCLWTSDCDVSGVVRVRTMCVTVSSIKFDRSMQTQTLLTGECSSCGTIIECCQQCSVFTTTEQCPVPGEPGPWYIVSGDHILSAQWHLHHQTNDDVQLIIDQWWRDPQDDGVVLNTRKLAFNSF